LHVAHPLAGSLYSPQSLAGSLHAGLECAAGLQRRSCTRPGTGNDCSDDGALNDGIVERFSEVFVDLVGLMG
jgi:hypothetical protein